MLHCVLMSYFNNGVISVEDGLGWLNSLGCQIVPNCANVSNIPLNPTALLSVLVSELVPSRLGFVELQFSGILRHIGNCTATALLRHTSTLYLLGSAIRKGPCLPLPERDSCGLAAPQGDRAGEVGDIGDVGEVGGRGLLAVRPSSFPMRSPAALA